MTNGFDTAWGEVTLVLFTTLAPSGVFAIVLIALFLIFAPIEVEVRRRINQFLVIPLAISMLGLVASATHLGNPANALYVFMGVGRSPLSNEVFSAIVFLFFGGVYWLYSFTQKERITLQKAWLALVVLSAIPFITTIAFAYNAETIISWNTVYVPLNLWLNAIVGGPILALGTLQVAHVPLLAERRFSWVLCVIALGALVANVTSMILQSIGLSSIENFLVNASDLVPHYNVMIAAYAIFACAGITLYARPLFKKKLPSLQGGVAANFLVLAGIFITRFSFYMMHMTVGLGV